MEMEGKVLVAYASTHGSTQEVAEDVARALQEHGAEVDLQLARNVRGLAGYSAVVLGAPLYMFRWHRDALQFLNRHQKALTGSVPVAIFAGGSIETSNEDELRGVRAQLDRELAKYPWFAPVSVEIVGGKFDPARLRFPWNLIPALKHKPYIDLRDWAAIRAWAGGLVDQFSCLKPDRQPASV